LEVQNKMHRKKVLGKDQLLFIWKNPKIYIDLPTSNIHCTWWEHLIRLRKALGRPIMRRWPQRGQRRYSSRQALDVSMEADDERCWMFLYHDLQ
jgi:hypothetical protein